ncbi:hypothetical protein [Candidatus Tisiphia endosymbiont of Mystacides longicornis]|uniref:hypothetical protein n=1 Tax=Candidatus Tisiphia endosymbiont of Mystacides longicornis TaxID=3139330 RepID=UPI003CCAAC39
MPKSTKAHLVITANRTFFCNKMPYISRPEHYYFEVLKDITLTVKYPIDIVVALNPTGAVKLPLEKDYCTFQNQSSLDSLCDHVSILNKDSITSLLLPIDTKASFTKNNITYHLENTTSEELVIENLNLVINIYEYLTGELPDTLFIFKINKITKMTLESHDIRYLTFYKMNQELIALFAKQNNGNLDCQKIDAFIQKHFSELPDIILKILQDYLGLENPYYLSSLPPKILNEDFLHLKPSDVNFSKHVDIDDNHTITPLGTLEIHEETQ